MIPQKGIQTQEETPRKQGYAMCEIVFDVCYRPAFSESPLGFRVPLGIAPMRGWRNTV